MKRRNLLKKFGVSAAGLSLATHSAAAQQADVARKMSVDTSGHEGLNEATVTLYDNGKSNVEMSGTKPADATGAAGFRVIVENLTDAQDNWVPEQATARIKELPMEALSQGPSSESDAGKSGEGTSTNSDIGTMSHGGSDSEADYQGGAFCRSEDWVDINLGITEGWIEWTTSSGEVDWVRHGYHAVTCDTGITTWYIDNAGTSYVDWGGSDVEVKFHGNYYNWDWSYNSNKTTAHHRIWTYGNPDGSMDWDTSHWHNGEDAGSLRTDAGWFSNYGSHTPHC